MFTKYLNFRDHRNYSEWVEKNDYESEERETNKETDIDDEI